MFGHSRSNSNVRARLIPEVLAMQSKLIYVLSAAVIMSTVAFGAHAADKLNYDSKSFAAAQAAGKPILVEFTQRGVRHARRKHRS